MIRRIGWFAVLALAWAAALGAGFLQESLLREVLASRMGLHLGELRISCGGIVEAIRASWKRRDDEISFAYARLAPRWMSLADGEAPWELDVRAPELRLRANVQNLEWPRRRMDGIHAFLRRVSVSFSQGRILADFGSRHIRLEELRAASRRDGSFRLDVPVIHMRTPEGEWLGKDTVVETRGRRWERVQIAFVRIAGPRGIWLDAGGAVERISSSVYGVDVYLRHAGEHATLRGRVNLDEERFILDVSFSTSISSLLEYASLLRPLGPALSMVQGEADGEAHVVWQKRPVLASLRMNLRGLTMAGAMFSTERLQFPDIRLESTARLEDGRVSFMGRAFMQGPSLRFSAEWSPGQNLKVDGSTDVRPCQEWLERGQSLLPHLSGMELDGTLGLRFGLWFDFQDPEKFNATADLSGDGCRVRRDAPGADPTLLQGPVTVQLRGRFGETVQRRLDPSDPAFVPLSRIPSHTIAAFLIAEDRRFREHAGFDWPMIIRAAGYNLKHRGFFKGASSISQQLVKNLYLSSARSVSRKLEEAILTWRMEQVLSKDRILELYLNIIEMGPGLFGIADGARVYFQRDVRNLIPVESAHLALVTPAPTFRFHNLRRRNIPDEWTAQVFSLLRKMRDAGAITPEQFQEARQRGLILQDY